MSTITFIGAGTAATGNNASVTPTAHASTAAGDLVLIQASIRNSGVGDVTLPTGWTSLVYSGHHRIMGRIWQAGDAMPTVTFTGGSAGDDTIGQAVTFRGVSAETLAQLAAQAAQLNGSAQNVSYPGLTVPADRHVVVLAAWKQADLTTISTPAGFTSMGTTGSTAGNDATQCWRYSIQTTAANITSGSMTVTGGVSAISRAFVFAMKPAATVTVTEQDVYPPRVLVSVTDLTLGDAVSVYRSVGGVRTLVQGATNAAVTDPSYLVIDAELPFGTPVSYVVDVNGIEYATVAHTYDLPGGKVVISDAINGLAAEVVIDAWDQRGYSRPASVFRAGGRNVVVSGDFGGFEADVELHTEAWSSAENLREVIDNATQGVVMVRQPGGYDGVDCHVAVTGYQERRASQDGTDERRRHTLHVVEVDGWAPTFTASGFTLQDIADAYAALTLTNIGNDYATLLALSQGDFS